MITVVVIVIKMVVEIVKLVGRRFAQVHHATVSYVGASALARVSHRLCLRSRRQTIEAQNRIPLLQLAIAEQGSKRISRIEPLVMLGYDYRLRPQ